MDLIITLLYIVFVLSAIVLVVVILLQEGRGGGFGQALGEHGQQTFGVGAKGINRFTMCVAGVFLLSAVALHAINRSQVQSSVLDATVTSADPTTQGAPMPQGAPPPK